MRRGLDHPVQGTCPAGFHPKGTGPRQIATLNVSENVKEGRRITAFDFPLPALLANGGVMGFGHVLALSGSNDKGAQIQIDITAFPGSSGSPLFNETGAVIGITTSRMNRKAIRQDDAPFIANLSFAVKSGISEKLLRK